MSTTPEVNNVVSTDTLPEMPSGTPVNDVKQSFLVPTNQHAFVHEALDVLATHPNVYAIDDQLVEVHNRRAVILRPEAVVTALCEVAECYALSGKDQTPKPVHIKGDQGKALHSATNKAPVRPLISVVTTPRLLKGGHLLWRPGYDAQSKLIFDPPCAWPEIPRRPSKQQAQAAYAQLADLFCDFAFVPDKEWGIAATIAGPLTVLARHSFDGAAPGFLYDASHAGAGKGLCAKIVGLIGHGEFMSSEAQRGADEQHKLIVSWFRAGKTCVVIDNIQKPLGGASLSVLLTEPKYGGRTLGASEHHTYDNRITVFFTGNNVIFRDPDMQRRVLKIRQEPNELVLSDRKFKHPRLESHVSSKRMEYTSAALTILLAYEAAGRPAQKLECRNSYESWSDAVAAPLVWLGAPDPFQRFPELVEVSEQEAAEQEMFGALTAAFQENELYARDVHTKIQHAYRHAHAVAGPTEWMLAGQAIASWLNAADGPRRNPPDLDARLIGRALGALRGWRAAGERRARFAYCMSSSGACWKLEYAAV